jgi:hypothetical protein
MAVLLDIPYSQFFDDNGNPLAGGKVYTYTAGTTTPKATYTDSGGLTPVSNPIILDASGRTAIWGDGFYRIDVKTAADVLIRSTDNITALLASGDMTKAIYDAANISQQLVGTSAVQTLTNKSITTSASAIAGAGFNLPHGAAPTSPVNGDLWTTTSGLFVRINGSTVTAGGKLVAQTSNTTNSVVTGTTAIPQDNTIPQITEGDQYLTVSHTPASAANILEIEGVLNLSSNAALNYLLVNALFQDAVTNALAVGVMQQVVVQGTMTVRVRHIMTAGTTSAITFRLRGGTSGGATTTLNGSGGAGLYGGAFISSITVREYTP